MQNKQRSLNTESQSTFMICTIVLLCVNGQIKSWGCYLESPNVQTVNSVVFLSLYGPCYHTHAERERRGREREGGKDREREREMAWNQTYTYRQQEFYLDCVSLRGQFTTVFSFSINKVHWTPAGGVCDSSFFYSFEQTKLCFTWERDCSKKLNWRNIIY